MKYQCKAGIHFHLLAPTSYAQQPADYGVLVRANRPGGMKTHYRLIISRRLLRFIDKNPSAERFVYDHATSDHSSRSLPPPIFAESLLKVL
jgi:hypothetical protein